MGDISGPVALTGSQEALHPPSAFRMTPRGVSAIPRGTTHLKTAIRDFLPVDPEEMASKIRCDSGHKTLRLRWAAISFDSAM